MHLECAKKDEHKAKKELGWIYGSFSKQFQLLIRIQLIAEYREVKGNLTNIKKVANLRAKQAHFTQQLFCLLGGHTEFGCYPFHVEHIPAETDYEYSIEG